MGEKQEVRISACVIMRDAAEDIGDCLASVEGIVDEMIVVDTGSVDDSIAIARGRGARIYEFPWREDFSAAKNYAIEQATGDWIFFLDADEGVTEETRQNIRPLLSRPGFLNQVDVILVTRRNIRTDTGEVETENEPERIFRRTPGLRFHDPIHECLGFEDGHRPRYLQLPRGRIVLWHRGYSPERARAKSDRNVRMLEAMRERGSRKLFLYFYLAREYLYREEYEKAAEAAKESIRRGECPGSRFVPYCQLCEAQEHLGDEEALLHTLRQGMEAHPLRPDFFAEYGRRMKKRGNLREALSYLEQAVSKEREFSKNFPGEQGAVEELPGIYLEMAEICRRMGNASKARSYRRTAEKMAGRASRQRGR